MIRVLIDTSRSKLTLIPLAHPTPALLASLQFYNMPTLGPLQLLFHCLEHTSTESLLILSERPSLITQYTILLFFFSALIITQHLFVCLLYLPYTRMQTPQEKGFLSLLHSTHAQCHETVPSI